MQDRDLIRCPHSGHAVRNEYRRAPAHDLAEVRENTLFGIGIDACQRVIENQNPRIADDCPCDCRALLLSAGEGKPALTDDSRVLLRESLNIARETRGFS